jgi:hypothetical protein
MDACRAKINALAPVDADVYATARTDFEALVAAQGPSFGRRLIALRAARAAFLLKAGPNSQPAEPYHRFAGTPETTQTTLDFSRVQCPLGYSKPALRVCKQVKAAGSEGVCGGALDSTRLGR